MQHEHKHDQSANITKSSKGSRAGYRDDHNARFDRRVFSGCLRLISCRWQPYTHGILPGRDGNGPLVPLFRRCRRKHLHVWGAIQGEWRCCSVCICNMVCEWQTCGTESDHCSAPSGWVAIDRSGAPTAVTIGGELYSQDVSIFLSDAVWGTKLESGMIRVTEREHGLGKIDFSSLGRLGLFGGIEMIPGRGIRYTGELTAGMEADLSPVYPYKIRTAQFTDSYNGFSVLDEHNAVVLREGLLRTKNFQFFEHEGRHFLIFVSRAVHNDSENAPWAVFGFAQVNPTLNRQNPSD